MKTIMIDLIINENEIKTMIASKLKHRIKKNKDNKLVNAAR